MLLYALCCTHANVSCCVDPARSSDLIWIFACLSFLTHCHSRLFYTYCPQVRINESDIERTPEILRAIEADDSGRRLAGMQRSLASVWHRYSNPDLTWMQQLPPQPSINADTIRLQTIHCVVVYASSSSLDKGPWIFL